MGARMVHFPIEQYFNVDTNEVVRRMAASVLPRKRLLDLVHDNPDLYGRTTEYTLMVRDANSAHTHSGPFWIASTVIFLLFVTNSIAKSIDAYSMLCYCKLLSKCAEIVICADFVSLLPSQRRQI